MLATAEAVASEEAVSRSEIDDVAALRHAQYATTGGGGEHVVPVVIPGRRGDLVLEADEGVRVSSQEELGALRSAVKDGLHTCGSQTHPADGAAGAVVTTSERARELSGGAGIVKLLGFGVARVDPARMRKAPVPAAQRALKTAGLTIDDVDLVTAHNPVRRQRRVLRPGDRLRPRPDEHPRLQPRLRAPAGPDGAPVDR